MGLRLNSSGGVDMVVTIDRDKRVFGIGTTGKGKHKTRDGNKHTVKYNKWHDMMRRCYSPIYLEKYPTYRGCTVCDEWHSFQTFGDWFNEHYTDGMQIDKDIKVEGNKHYSPETCMFVSHAENTEKAGARHYTLISPTGESVSIYNMSKFCRGKGLDPSAMRKVAKGDIDQHKGWVV